MQTETKQTLVSLTVSFALALVMLAWVDPFSIEKRGSEALSHPQSFGWSWNIDPRQAFEEVPSPLSPTPTGEKSGAPNQPLLLIRNIPRGVGQVTLVYRGFDLWKGTFRIDTLIPALDSEVTYPRQLRVDDARREFTVGGLRFRLTDIGRQSLQLVSLQ